MNIPVQISDDFDEARADRLGSVAGPLDPVFAQLFITPVDNGLVVGIVAGASKISLKLPTAGIPALARQLLEHLLSGDASHRKKHFEEFDRIHHLVTTDEDRARHAAEALARALLAVETDRQAAVEQGRRQGGS
jgi:hypothetical protein